MENKGRSVARRQDLPERDRLARARWACQEPKEPPLEPRALGSLVARAPLELECGLEK